MRDLDLDELLQTMPVVTLPAGVTVTAWRRHTDDERNRSIEADLKLTAGGRDYQRTLMIPDVGFINNVPNIMRNKIVPAIRDGLAELRAEALIIV